jgi:hypothetical protein
MNNLQDQLAVKTGLGKRVLTSAPGAPTTCSSPLLFSSINSPVRTKIYCLRDEHGHIRNIGKTSKPLECRLAGHLYEAQHGGRNHRCNGIRAMLRRGFTPIINLITEVKNNNGNDAEIAYIKYYRERGFNLWNETDGGDGNSNPSVETRQKISIRLTGKVKPALREKYRKLRLEQEQKTYKQNMIAYQKYLKYWETAPSIEEAELERAKNEQPN